MISNEKISRIYELLESGEEAPGPEGLDRETAAGIIRGEGDDA